MLFRMPAILVLATIPLAVGLSAASEDCSATIPNGKGPNASLDSFGNGKLSTTLWPAGKVLFLPGGPGSLLANGSLSMKFWWWRAVHGELTIEGRRLDALAPSLKAYIPKGYGDIGFQATAIIFPTPGCWEVTGKVGETSLTFVTLVVRKSNQAK